uniref:Uncharacterized protein n=1 Tax=Acrobeloides nanus TaxID=290746 RepID=A0A914DP91_9BILA
MALIQRLYESRSCHILLLAIIVTHIVSGCLRTRPFNPTTIKPTTTPLHTTTITISTTTSRRTTTSISTSTRIPITSTTTSPPPSTTTSSTTTTTSTTTATTTTTTGCPQPAQTSAVCVVETATPPLLRFNRSIAQCHSNLGNTYYFPSINQVDWFVTGNPNDNLDNLEADTFAGSGGCVNFCICDFSGNCWVNNPAAPIDGWDMASYCGTSGYTNGCFTYVFLLSSNSGLASSIITDTAPTMTESVASETCPGTGPCTMLQHNYIKVKSVSCNGCAEARQC